MALHPPSLIIVGGGIVGLCLASLAQSRGYAVTVVARDAVEATASGVAAGMIAPALEAINDADPALSYRRLQSAQAAWLEDFEAWPSAVQALLAQAQSRPSLYVVGQSDPWSAEARLQATGAAYHRLGWDEMRGRGLDPERQAAFSLPGDWLVEAMPLLAAFRYALVRDGATFVRAAVTQVGADQVVLENGEVLTADAVIIAAGYGARRFADMVPSLANLQPIKGHLLDIAGLGNEGVVRADTGYLAGYGRTAKFGASMQPGRDDLDIESDVVETLKARADFLPDASGLSQATPRVGIRASTPDGWPLIGRDAASGVWVATGMRRNGYVFAPFAARAILAEIAGDAAPTGTPDYDPNRF